jgi:hypothetical protein
MILVLVLGLSVAAGREDQDRPATPAKQYEALAKAFSEAANAFYVKATTDEDRVEPLARIVELSPRCLELAEKHPKDPVALDALVQVVTQELWLKENTSYPGRGKDSLEARAIAILLRDHARSDRLSEACRRMSYGFSKECESFLRTVLERNPQRDIQALACLRLAEFLNRRLERRHLLTERPEMTRRYEGLFGKDYVDALQRQDCAKAVNEVERLFERAAAQYGDVKVPYAGTVREKAQEQLFELRHLTVGREALPFEGQDQDGQHFRLKDYRGKVVLLYFWSEY